MANTYTSLHVHYVFSTKHREPLIVPKLQNRLWAYMGGIARENRMLPLRIGGVADHVHALVSLPASLSVSKGVQLIKGASSAWVSTSFRSTRQFAWQAGYGAFSVSASQISTIVRYIEGQEAHHRTTTFQEEYRAFLEKHGIPFDERYVWD